MGYCESGLELNALLLYCLSAVYLDVAPSARLLICLKLRDQVSDGTQLHIQFQPPKKDLKLGVPCAPDSRCVKAIPQAPFQEQG